MTVNNALITSFDELEKIAMHHILSGATDTQVYFTGNPDLVAEAELKYSITISYWSGYYDINLGNGYSLMIVRNDHYQFKIYLDYVEK